MEGEGMVAVVRGLRDSGLTVTLVDGSRQYTLMPNATSAHSATRQRSPVANSNVSTQQSPLKTTADSSTDPSMPLCDSGAQAIDGRYASTYRTTHCHLRPTSPPVQLTEFPPQRPDIHPGHGNFQVGGQGSGATFSPIKPTSPSNFRGGLSWPDRGSVCSPRPSHEVDAFANSLRRYPNLSPDRSSEMVERLINYTQNKGISKTFPRNQSSPVRLPEPGSQNNFDLKGCTRTSRLYEPEMLVRNKKVEEAPTRDKKKDDHLDFRSRGYDVRCMRDISKRLRDSVKAISAYPYTQPCPTIKETNHNEYPVYDKHSMNSVNMEIQAAVKMISKEVSTVYREKPPGTTVAVLNSPTTSQHERNDKGECFSGTSPSTNTFKYIQIKCCPSDTVLKPRKSALTVFSSIEFYPRHHQHYHSMESRRSRSQEEIKVTDDDLRRSLLELIEDISTSTKTKKRIRDELIKKLFDTDICEKEEKKTERSNTKRERCHKYVSTFWPSGCDYVSDFEELLSKLKNCEGDTKNENMSDKSVIRNPEHKQLDFVLKDWINSLNLKNRDDLDRGDILNSVEDKIKKVFKNRTKREFDLKSEVVKIIGELPIEVNNGYNKKSYLHRLVDVLLKRLKSVVINQQKERNRKSYLYRSKKMYTKDEVNSFLNDNLSGLFDECNLKLCDNIMRGLQNELIEILMDSMDCIQCGHIDDARDKMWNSLQVFDQLTDQQVEYITNGILHGLQATLDERSYSQTYTVLHSNVSGQNAFNANDTECGYEDLNANHELYTNQLNRKINEWLDTLNIPQIQDRGFREVVVNDLAGDIADRHKYLDLNPKIKGSKEDELENLKYQIFKWINKLVGEENTETIGHAQELMKSINSIPIPMLTDPALKRQPFDPWRPCLGETGNVCKKPNKPKADPCCAKTLCPNKTPKEPCCSNVACQNSTHTRDQSACNSTISTSIQGPDYTPGYFDPLQVPRVAYGPDQQSFGQIPGSYGQFFQNAPVTYGQTPQESPGEFGVQNAFLPDPLINSYGGNTNQGVSGAGAYGVLNAFPPDPLINSYGGNTNQGVSGAGAYGVLNAFPPDPLINSYGGNTNQGIPEGGEYGIQNAFSPEPLVDSYDENTHQETPKGGELGDQKVYSPEQVTSEETSEVVSTLSPETLKELTDEYDEYIKEWVHKIPIPATNPSEQEIAEKARLSLYNGIWKAITKLKLDPEVFANPYNYQDAFDEELEGLLKNLPKSDELNAKKGELKEQLLEKTMEMNDKIRMANTNNSFKQHILETIEDNLPQRKNDVNLNEHIQQNEEVLKQDVAEYYILYSRYKDDELKANGYNRQFLIKLEQFFNTLKNDGGITLGPKYNANEIINALEKVPVLNKNMVQDEADDILLSIEVENWISDVPEFKDSAGPLEKRRIRDAIVKKIQELGSRFDYSDFSFAKPLKEELQKILDKISVEPGSNMDFMIEELANRVKSIARSIKPKSVTFEDPHTFDELNRNMIASSSNMESPEYSPGQNVSYNNMILGGNVNTDSYPQQQYPLFNSGRLPSDDDDPQNWTPFGPSGYEEQEWKSMDYTPVPAGFFDWSQQLQPQPYGQNLPCPMCEAGMGSTEPSIYGQVYSNFQRAPSPVTVKVPCCKNWACLNKPRSPSPGISQATQLNQGTPILFNQEQSFGPAFGQVMASTQAGPGGEANVIQYGQAPHTYVESGPFMYNQDESFGPAAFPYTQVIPSFQGSLDDKTPDGAQYMQIPQGFYGQSSPIPYNQGSPIPYSQAQNFVSTPYGQVQVIPGGKFTNAAQYGQLPHESYSQLFSNVQSTPVQYTRDLSFSPAPAFGQPSQHISFPLQQLHPQVPSETKLNQGASTPYATFLPQASSQTQLSQTAQTPFASLFPQGLSETKLSQGAQAPFGTFRPRVPNQTQLSQAAQAPFATFRPQVPNQTQLSQGAQAPFATMDKYSNVQEGSVSYIQDQSFSPGLPTTYSPSLSPILSPSAQDISVPSTQMSPQRISMSPQGFQMSPQGFQMSPQEIQTLQKGFQIPPQGTQLSPYGTQILQYGSPQGVLILPQDIKPSHRRTSPPIEDTERAQRRVSTSIKDPEMLAHMLSTVGLTPVNSETSILGIDKPKRTYLSKQETDKSARRTSFSPYRTEISPEESDTSSQEYENSPERKSFTQKDKEKSPERKSLTPQNTKKSPERKSYSRNDTDTWPERKSLSLENGEKSFERNFSTPTDTKKSPEKKSFPFLNALKSPERKSSSRKDEKSTERKSITRQDTEKTSERKSFSGKDTEKSPERKSLTPQDTEKLPERNTFSGKDIEKWPERKSLSLENGEKSLEKNSLIPTDTGKSPERKSFSGKDTEKSPERKPLSLENGEKSFERNSLIPTDTGKSPERKSVTPQDTEKSQERKSFSSKVTESSSERKSLTPQDTEKSPERKSFSGRDTEKSQEIKSLTSQDTEKSQERKSFLGKDTENSPERKSLTPQDTEKCPERKSLTPQDTEKSPERKSFSGRDTEKSQERKSFSGKDTENSPERKSLTPQDTEKSPERKSFSGRDTENLPERMSLTPQDTEKSPERKSLLLANGEKSFERNSLTPTDSKKSPEGKSITPQDTEISSEETNTSSQENEKSPERKSFSQKDKERKSSQDTEKSTKRQSLTPQDTEKSPERKSLPPQDIEQWPERKSLSLANGEKSFERNSLTPTDSKKSPERKSITPQDTEISSEETNTSSQENEKSPERKSFSQKDKERKSSQDTEKSTKRQSLTPQDTEKSPERKSLPPQDIETSPERKFFSGKDTEKWPERKTSTPTDTDKISERKSLTPTDTDKLSDMKTQSLEKAVKSLERKSFALENAVKTLEKKSYTRPGTEKTQETETSPLDTETSQQETEISPPESEESPQRRKSHRKTSFSPLKPKVIVPDTESSPERTSLSKWGTEESPQRISLSTQKNLIFPQGTQTSSQGPQMSPHGTQIPPYGTQVSPQGNQMSSYGNQMSPYGNQMSPYGYQMSPQGVPVAPHGMQMIPQGMQMTPQGLRMGPQGMQMAPQGGQMTPQGMQMAPQGVQMTPQGIQMSPQGNQTSPQGIQMSPQGGQMAQQGGQIAPHGGQMAPHGGEMAPQGGQMAPHGGQMAPQGMQMAPPGFQMTPQGIQMSPQGNQTSPQGIQMSSQGGQMAPQGGQMAPHGGQMSSQGGQMSSQGGQMAPHGGQMTSQGGQMAPQGGQMAPQGGQMAPQGMQMAPQGGQMAPHGGQMSSHGGQMAPQGGQMAPHGGQMAPQGGQMAPQGMQMAPQGGQMAPHGGQMSSQGGQMAPQGGQMVPHGGQMSSQGGQMAPHGGQMAPHGGQMSSQGGQLAPHGGQMSSPGGQMAPHGGQMLSQGGQLAPQGGQLAPQGGQMAPYGGQMSLQGGQMAPQGGQMVSHGGQMAPHGGQMPPKGGQMAPHGGQMSSLGGQMAPQGMQMAPQGGQMAPHGGQMTPQGTPMSPYGTPMAPHGSQMTPQGMQMAPQGGQMTPHGGQMAQHGGQMAQQGGQMAPQGGQMAPHGGQMSSQGGQMTPHCGQMAQHGGQMAPHAGQMVTQGGQMAPHAGQMAPHAGQMVPQGGQITPHSGHITPHGGQMAQHGGQMAQHGGQMAPQGMQMAPHGVQMTPQGAPMSPHGTPMAPHGTPMAPHGTQMSPQKMQISPQGNQMPPYGNKMAPYGMQISPQGIQMSPQGTKMSPQGVQMSPQKMQISPQGMQILPHGTQIPPHGTQIPPHGAQMGPHVTQMAPHATQMAPQGTQMAPQGIQMAPHGTKGAPYGTQMAPHDTQMAPHGTQMSPYGTQISPQGTKMAPHGTQMPPQGSQKMQISPQGAPITTKGTPMSPYGTQMSPYGAQMSPQKMQMSPQSNYNQISRGNPGQPIPGGQGRPVSSYADPRFQGQPSYAKAGGQVQHGNPPGRAQYQESAGHPGYQAPAAGRSGPQLQNMQPMAGGGMGVLGTNQMPGTSTQSGRPSRAQLFQMGGVPDSANKATQPNFYKSTDSEGIQQVIDKSKIQHPAKSTGTGTPASASTPGQADKDDSYPRFQRPLIPEKVSKKKGTLKQYATAKKKMELTETETDTEKDVKYCQRYCTCGTVPKEVLKAAEKKKRLDAKEKQIINIKSVQTAFSTIDIKTTKYCEIRSKSQEELTKITKKQEVIKRREIGNVDLQQEVTEWFEIHRDKVKVKLWGDKMQKLADKLKKPGGEEKLRMKIEKYLKKVPDQLSDGDEDRQEFRRQLPDDIIRKLKTLLLNPPDTDMNVYSMDLSRYSSRFRTENLNKILINWLKNLNIKKKDFLGRTVKKEDVFKFVTDKLEPLILDRPKCDAEYRAALKSIITDILEDLPLVVGRYNKEYFINKVAESLVNDILSIENKLPNTYIQPTNKEVREFVKDEITFFLETARIALSTKRIECLESELVDILVGLTDVVDIDSYVSEDVTTKFKDIGKLPEYKAKYFANILLKDYREFFFRQTVCQVKDKIDSGRPDVYTMFKNTVVSSSSDVPTNYDDYTLRLIDEISKWVCKINIPDINTHDAGSRTQHCNVSAFVVDLANDIVDRHKYLLLNPSSNGTDAEECEHLKYQIYKWTYKLVGDENTAVLGHAKELFDKINTIPKPQLSTDKMEPMSKNADSRIDTKPYVDKLTDLIFGWFNELPTDLYVSQDASLNKQLIRDLAEALEKGDSKSSCTGLDEKVNQWTEKIFNKKLNRNDTEKLKNRIKSLHCVRDNEDKNSKQEKAIIRFYEDVIDDWIDKVPMEHNKAGVLIKNRNEFIHELALKIYNTKTKLNKLPDEVVEKKLHEGISEWMKKLPLPLDDYNFRNKHAMKLVIKIQACDIIDESKCERTIKTKEEFIVEEHKKAILDWLKTLPLYKNIPSKDKENHEPIIKQLVNDIHGSIIREHEYPHEDIIRHIKMLYPTQNNEFIESAASHLKLYLQNLNSFGKISQCAVSKDFAANIENWVNSLLLDGTDLTRINNQKTEFIQSMKRLKSSGSDHGVLKKEIITFMKSLPLANNVRNDNCYLNEEAFRLLIQLSAASIDNKSNQSLPKNNEIISGAIKDWANNLPLKPMYCPRELRSFIDDMSSVITSLLLKPEYTTKEDNDQRLNREIVKFLRRFPLQSEQSSEKYISRMAKELVNKLKKIDLSKDNVKSNKNDGVNITVYGVSFQTNATDASDFTMQSINEEDLNANINIYIGQLVNHISQWFNSLNLPNVPEEAFKEVVINDLAGDMVDRHKYLELNPESRGTDEDELEHLKYQIFKWINKLVGEENLETIEHAEDLMKRVQSVPVPMLVKPSTNFQTVSPPEECDQPELPGIPDCCQQMMNRELIAAGLQPGVLQLVKDAIPASCGRYAAPTATLPPVAEVTCGVPQQPTSRRPSCSAALENPNQVTCFPNAPPSAEGCRLSVATQPTAPRMSSPAVIGNNNAPNYVTQAPGPVQGGYYGVAPQPTEKRRSCPATLGNINPANYTTESSSPTGGSSCGVGSQPPAKRVSTPAALEPSNRPSCCKDQPSAAGEGNFGVPASGNPNAANYSVGVPPPAEVGSYGVPSQPIVNRASTSGVPLQPIANKASTSVALGNFNATEFNPVLSLPTEEGNVGLSTQLADIKVSETPTDSGSNFGAASKPTAKKMSSPVALERSYSPTQYNTGIPTPTWNDQNVVASQPPANRMSSPAALGNNTATYYNPPQPTAGGVNIGISVQPKANRMSSPAPSDGYSIKNCCTDIPPTPPPTPAALDGTKEAIYEKYQKIFREKCDVLPIHTNTPESVKLADLAKTGIYNGIVKTFFKLKADPEIENDYGYFEFMLEEKVEEMLDVLPQTEDLINRRHAWKLEILANAIDMLDELHGLTDRPSFRQRVRNKFNRKFARDLELEECFLLQQGFLAEMADAYILETKYKDENPVRANIYKNRLMKKIDDLTNHLSKEHNVGFRFFNKPQLANLAMKVLGEVPIPNDDVLKEEAEEIQLADEVDKWYKELPTKPLVNETDGVLRKRMIDLLAKKLYDLEKHVTDPSKEAQMKHEVSQFLEKRAKLDTDQDLNINLMVEELHNRLKNRWLNEPADYNAFANEIPLSSTLTQYMPPLMDAATSTGHPQAQVGQEACHGQPKNQSLGQSGGYGPAYVSQQGAPQNIGQVCSGPYVAYVHPSQMGPTQDYGPQSMQGVPMQSMGSARAPCRPGYDPALGPNQAVLSEGYIPYQCPHVKPRNASLPGSMHAGNFERNQLVPGEGYGSQSLPPRMQEPTQPRPDYSQVRSPQRPGAYGPQSGEGQPGPGGGYVMIQGPPMQSMPQNGPRPSRGGLRSSQGGNSRMQNINQTLNGHMGTGPMGPIPQVRVTEPSMEGHTRPYGQVKSTPSYSNQRQPSQAMPGYAGSYGPPPTALMRSGVPDDSERDNEYLLRCRCLEAYRRRRRCFEFKDQYPRYKPYRCFY